MNVSGYRQMLNKGLVVMGEFQLQSVTPTIQNQLYFFFKKYFKFSKYSMILLLAVKVLICVVSPAEF